MGSSHGGLAAIWLARAHPDAIGNVISQSASLWWSPERDSEPEFLARAMAQEPRREIRFWLEVGSFETDRTNGGGPGQVDVSRHFRDVLMAKGYDVVFSEFPGGHEYQSWRVTTPRALRHFLGSKE
ncbi:MAG: alpha/beta hydrolase-fold protein [Gemmatimonadaceae bacterium]